MPLDRQGGGCLNPRRLDSGAAQTREAFLWLLTPCLCFSMFSLLCLCCQTFLLVSKCPGHQQSHHFFGCLFWPQEGKLTRSLLAHYSPLCKDLNISLSQDAAGSRGSWFCFLIVTGCSCSLLDKAVSALRLYPVNLKDF